MNMHDANYHNQWICMMLMGNYFTYEKPNTIFKACKQRIDRVLQHFQKEKENFLKVAGEYEHSNAKTLGGMGLYQSESNMATIAR